MKHITLSALALLLSVACKKDKKTEPVNNPPQSATYKKVKTTRTVSSNSYATTISYQLNTYDAQGRISQTAISDSVIAKDSSITVDRYTEFFTYGPSGKIEKITLPDKNILMTFFLDAQQNFSGYILEGSNSIIDTVTFSRSGNTTVATERSGTLLSKRFFSRNLDSVQAFDGQGKIAIKEFYNYSSTKDLVNLSVSAPFPAGFFSENELTDVVTFSGKDLKTVNYQTYQYVYKDGYPVSRIYKNVENNFTELTFYTYY